jgi:hypothetical protein
MRAVEDYERVNGKQLADTMPRLVAQLYHDVSGTCAEMAKEHGLHAVLAYPGNLNTTNPVEMELLLKVPAAHPLYLDPASDYTDELIERLNAKFAADNGD